MRTKLNGVEQIQDAYARLNQALQAINRFEFESFTENEVRFRLETISNMILIVQSDLAQMKKEWQGKQ